MEQRKISFNGCIAYREGSTLSDNPFDQSTQANAWDCWRTQFEREQAHRVGPPAYPAKI